MSNQEQKKPSMAEALGSRMNEKETTISQPTIPKKPDIDSTGMPETNPAEELTEDEIVEQALAEAKSETVMLNQETPQVEQSQSKKSLEAAETIPVQPETVASTNSLPEKGLPTTLASNIDRPHVTENSTQESVEPLTEEKSYKQIGDVVTDYPSEYLSKVIRDPDYHHLRRLIEYIHSNEYSEAWVQLHISSISSFPRVLPTPTLWDIPSSVDIAALVYQVVLTTGFVENTWPYLRLIMGTCRDNVGWSAGVLTTLALFEAIKLLPYTIQRGQDDKEKS